MLTLSDFQLLAQLAIFAVVVSDILTRPKMILERYGRWLDKLETTRPKLAYPLGYCAKCLAGFSAIILFACIKTFGYQFLHSFPVQCVFFVADAILFADFLSLVLALLKR